MRPSSGLTTALKVLSTTPIQVFSSQARGHLTYFRFGRIGCDVVRPSLLSVLAVFWKGCCSIVTLDQAFEVINLAMRGINSHMIRRIAMEAAVYEPDLVIVYAGNNELVGWQAPEPDQAPLRPLKMIRAQQALLSTRLGQWLWQRIRPFKDEWNQEQDMAFFRKHHLSAKDPRREEVLSRFAGNMSEALEVFVVQRVPVLVGSVLVNERDFPPWDFHPHPRELR